jgi:signal transduction histidine kinase/ActR/RegA family two-component response regulator
MIVPFRDRPIRDKVALLIVVAAIVGMGLTGGVVLAYDLITFRPRIVRDLGSQAEIIELNTIPALLFNDPDAAAENLGTLRSRPEVAAGYIFLPADSLFAAYDRDSTTAPRRDPGRLIPGNRFGPGRLVVTRTLSSDGRVLGYLTLEYDLPSLWTRLPQYGFMAAAVLLALFTASVLLSGTLTRTVSTPLRRLAEAARQITATRDFRVRVPKQADDEIGELTRAFNEMLGTIETTQGALHRSEERLRLALEAAAMRTTEVPSVDALLEDVHHSDRDRVRRMIAQSLDAGQRFDVEFRAAIEGNAEKWLALRGHVSRGEDGRPTQLLGVLQDVTERHRLEVQLIQSQKMEAIGNLAGGIAHDFNNLLTAIIGYVRFVERALPAGSPIRDDVAEIDSAARRAALLTSQLLSYARRQMVVPTPVDVNVAVTGLRPMLRRLLSEDIEIETALDPDVWPTRIDRGQFEQLIVNMAVNARDAMPQGGTLRLETRNMVLGEDDARRNPEMLAGEYAVLSIGDTGVGMTPEVVARLFEPFFTTKPIGQGTGLGLAMCYGIVKQAGGHLTVSSERGRGSVFRVILPRLVAAEVRPPAPEDVAEIPPGDETVLFAEDDPAVREMSLRTLRGAGYEVVEADGGESAIAAARAHHAPIHLLVTDVVMPGMSGRELVEVLCRENPDLKVVFISGYTEDVIVRRGVTDERMPFLAKPFTPAQLARTVRTALDGAVRPV